MYQLTFLEEHLRNPLCAYIGKRYTIIISMAVFLAANIWTAKADGYNSFIATRIVGGLGGGIIEALVSLIVSELFPEHQLGRAMVTISDFLQ
jgi:predicted MFS family arabinose efflux permease